MFRCWYQNSGIITSYQYQNISNDTQPFLEGGAKMGKIFTLILSSSREIQVQEALIFFVCLFLPDRQTENNKYGLIKLAWLAC